jgi:hypothetical protein
MALEEMTGWLLGFGYGYAAAQTKNRILSASDEAFLADQASRVCVSAELKPGAANAGWRNVTPYTLHVPGGNMGYHAFWVRDSDQSGLGPRLKYQNTGGLPRPGD